MIDVAGTHAMLKAVSRTFFEKRVRRLQPGQDVAAHRIGQRLEDGVGVDAGLRARLIGG
ncbi:hypothetical protein D3C72_2590340 [compost metagenome]